jgi:hydrogenase/urease accessory protein HupE
VIAHRLAFFAVLFCPLETFAHRLNISHIDVREAEDALQIAVDVDPHDLPLYERIDLDGDGVLTLEEVERQRTALEALIAGRIEVKGKRSVCVRGETHADFHQSTSNWHTDVSFACPKPAREHVVYFGYIDTLPRGHQAFVRVSSEGRVRLETALSPRHAFIDARDVGRLSLFVELATLGVHHIFSGYDHIAFVLALLISASSVRGVLLRLTSFTLAHSLTLALALTGLVRISPSIVEPLIALSIACVALERLWKREQIFVSTALAFAFGLLHGLGFASALEEAAFSEQAFALSIAGFNVGLELAQAAIALIVWPLIRRAPEALKKRSLAGLVVLGVVWCGARLAGFAL